MDVPPHALKSRAERWFLAGLIALFAAVSVQYTAKVLTPRNGETTRSAIVRWRDQLLQLDAGENIYERFTYPNPPIMALMLTPIAKLPLVTGALVWYFVKVGLALASFLMAFRLAQSAGVPFPPWAKGLTVLLSLRPVLGDLMHGNVNLLIAFLVLAGLVLYQERRDLLAGVLIALAASCKVTPMLFLPYFVWKRSWRVVAGMMLGLVLFLLVVPSLFLGWTENRELLSSWIERMVLPFLMGGQITSEHSNQSLPGLVQRLLTHSPSFSEYQNDGYVATAHHNFVDLGGHAKWLVKVVVASFSLGVLWTCRTPTMMRRSPRLAAEFSVILLGMLLLSERTWKHHAVTMVLPFAVLMYYLSTQIPTSRLRSVLVMTIVASALLMAATSTAIIPDDWAKLAQVYGAYTWVFIVQSCVLMRLLRLPQQDCGQSSLPLAQAA